MKMIRGTTPTYNFTLPVASSQISKLFVTFSQNDEIIVEKNKDEIELTDVTENANLIDTNSGDSLEENDSNSSVANNSSYCTVTLTQEDTLSFKSYKREEKNIIVVGVRFLTTDGVAYASEEPILIRLRGVVKNGKI